MPRVLGHKYRKQNWNAQKAASGKEKRVQRGKPGGIHEEMQKRCTCLVEEKKLLFRLRNLVKLCYRTWRWQKKGRMIARFSNLYRSPPLQLAPKDKIKAPPHHKTHYRANRQ